MASIRGYITPVVPGGAPSSATISIGTENSAWYAGDYVIFFCYSRSTGSRTWVEDDSGYGGVPELTESVTNFDNDGTNFFSTRVIYRKLTAGNRTSYTLKHSSQGGGQIVWGVIVQDADGSNLLDQTIATNSGTGTLTATYPDVTTLTDNALVLYHSVWTDNASTSTGAELGRVAEPSKGAEFVEWVGTNTTLQIAYYTKTPAGAVGTTTAVATNSGADLNTSDYWLTYTVAIKTASAAAFSGIEVIRTLVGVTH